MLHVIVDAANVVGARPDGWWRDRPGAARRLAGRIVAALTVDPAPLADGLGHPHADLQVHLVLEGAAAGVQDLPTHPRLTVVRATADGDETIATVAAGLAPEAPVLVVTADRALKERVRAVGASTAGPGRLLGALPPP